MASKGVFRVRLNCVDHYQGAVTTLDPPLWGPHLPSASQRNGLPHVPIIRVFGATETGQKVCMHVHGAFPYLYVPYQGSVEQSELDSYIATFRHSADHALALSYRRNPYEDPRNAAFIAHISLVKGVPFFGYHVGYKYYLKIYLLNPLHMTRFTDLLQQGAILKQAFQPYEAHLQYLLQWMCDFNLYGCAFVETKKPRFRLPVPSVAEVDDSAHRWHEHSISNDQLLDPEQFPRQSHCQLELDIGVEDILNRHAIQARPLHHSFIERLSTLDNLPIEEKLVHSMAGLWKDETRRRKLRMGLTDPSSSPFPPEVLVSMSADPRNSADGGWIHEEDFREAVVKLAEQERQTHGGGEMSFDQFDSQHSGIDNIQTVFESVQELFSLTLEQKRRAAMAASHESDAGADADSVFLDMQSQDAKKDGTLIIDMSSIALVRESDEPVSDEDAAKDLALGRSKSRREAAIEKGLDVAGLDSNGDTIEVQHGHRDGAWLSTDTSERTFGAPNKRGPGSTSQKPFKKARMENGDAPTGTTLGKFRVRDIKPPIRSHMRHSHNNSTEHPPGAQISHVKPSRYETTRVPPSSQPTSTPNSSQQSQDLKNAFPLMKNGDDLHNSLRLSQRYDLAQPTRHATQKNSSVTSSTRDTSSLSTTATPGKSMPSIHPYLAKNYANTFRSDAKVDSFIFGVLPPSSETVETTLDPTVIYQDAYYSNEKDVPDRPREYAGQEFRLVSTTLPYLQSFERDGRVREGKVPLPDKKASDLRELRQRRQCTLKSWEIMQAPPTWDEVDLWLHDGNPQRLDDLEQPDDVPTTSQLKRKNRPAPELSQVEGPTQKNQHGFKYSQRKASTSVRHETGYMSTMSLEVHVNSRADLAPDPERDEVNLITWCITDEQTEGETKFGIVVCSSDDKLFTRIRLIAGTDVRIDSEDSELDLINKLVDIVRSYDPDILTGFEVHNNSWGYLIERARLGYEYNLPDEFSRMKSQSHGRFGKDADRWGFTHTSTLRITGRHTINIWRAMRSELNLLQYTMENVVFHLLHRRIPHYSFQTLTKWYQSGKSRDLVKVLDYLILRTKLDLDILAANELIPRTSEQARLLGVDFFSVFSRGSQFKVESLMFRIAKPESFVLVSPSRKQVGAQNALECLPLVMEPQSAFYSSPLLVLDFQSLYPSVMIAYNYCYSTCLGRITEWRGANKLGFADFKRTPGLLELVQDKLNISPNGMMYVKPEMRKSLLAKMLGEILETRVMVKSGMKVDQDDKTLQQLLNNRQLALKLIANVTYGYTSASFSGRMPCSEIADSIVQTARETLEKAIAFIHSVERWGAEVVYGDTDSLFIYLKGRTRDDAFKIGDEIAKAVTDLNPRPVKLKFEKVYHPCVLLAKKRYVGFKYESPKQTEPEFDAKGIETVRRDGTPAEQKIEEKALKILFRSSDLSMVKSYFQAQCAKILKGRISIQDFCFAKEVKLGTYADKGPPPPGALIATRRMLRDPRMEPQYGERIPYVVIAGAPGARLWERCVEPDRLINDEHAELDAEYYINKNLIPPLERIFNLVGANVRQWYDEMPKVQRIRSWGATHDKDARRNGKTMESYMAISHCLVCRTKLPPHRIPSDVPLCHTCHHVETPRALFTLRGTLRKAERRTRDLLDVCRSCAELPFAEEVCCDSRDCPVFYSRSKAETQLSGMRRSFARVLDELEGEGKGREEFDW